MGGIRECATREEADALWRVDREELKRLYECERTARQRFLAALTKVRTLLLSGKWKAFVLDRETGEEYEIPAKFWLSDAAPVVFELQDDLEKWYSPNAMSFLVRNGTRGPRTIRGSVIVPKDCLSETGGPSGGSPPLTDPPLIFSGKTAATAKSANEGASTRKRSSPQSERAQRAIAERYPNGVPDPIELPNSLLCRAVSETIKNQEKNRQGPKLRDVSDDVIERAAARRK